MFDLPDSYFQNTDASDRISQLMQYTLLSVLELEFRPIYRKDWWEQELKPHILQMDASFDTFSGTDRQKATVAKYHQLMNSIRHKRRTEPDLGNLDVTALSTVLLYDETYQNLDIRQEAPSSKEKYRSVMAVKNCRNEISHGDVESSQRARKRVLKELRILMQLYGRSYFGSNLVQEVYHYDPEQPSTAGRQAEPAHREGIHSAAERSAAKRQAKLALQQEFGQYYNSFLEASTQLKRPQTRPAALDTMRQLAKAGYHTAIGQVLDVVLHDPQYFNLQEAVELLDMQKTLTRDETVQLTLLRSLQQKEEAARAGDAAAAMEAARMVAARTSLIYAPDRESIYYLWAWQADHKSGLAELQAAAQGGMTSAWDALCQTREPAAMDWLADQLHSGKLPGGKSWAEISPWLFRLFDQGSQRALAILAERMGISSSCCCIGPGNSDWCRVCQRACEAGYLNALMHRLKRGGQPCNNSPEKRSETLALCQRLAERDPDAGQVALAGCMIQGIGQPADLEQARTLIPGHLLTASGNHPSDGRGVRAAALYWAGQICEYGFHPDPGRAADYYRKSAACGDFPPAGVQVFLMDAASHDPQVRRAAYDTLSRLEKRPTDCVRLGFHLSVYQNISLTDGFLRRNRWIRNADYVKMALWIKWINDITYNRNNSSAVSLFVHLSNCKREEEILPALHGWEQNYTPAAAQLEALYLLTRPQPDLAGAREAWNRAVPFRQKPAPAGVRDHGVFRSHGRKDRIAQALQTGVAPAQLYDLLKNAGFRIPHFRRNNQDILMGVGFASDNPFYRWLSAVYLDRYEKERDALVASTHKAKLERIRWFEASRTVQRAGRPGLPDFASAVRLYLAEQGDAQAMQALLDSRTSLTGSDRLHRNLALADLILQGRAPGGHTGEEGRALLMECLDHVPDSHARAVVLCTLGRYETTAAQRLTWFQRAQNVDPDGLLPCAALMDAYLQANDYRDAVQQADRFWLKLDLNPYRGQKLSTAWPSTQALLDLPTVNAWAVALGQRAYQELLQNDSTLTTDNRAALKALVQLDCSVGDWHTYKQPTFWNRLSPTKRIVVFLIIIYLLIGCVIGAVKGISQSPGSLVILCVAVIAFLIYRRWRK